MSNPAFWEAARWLVDYDGITKNLLKGQYFTHQSFLPVGFPEHWKKHRLPFNPAKAKRSSLKPESKTRTSRLMSKINRHLLPSRSQFRPAFAQGGVKLICCQPQGVRSTLAFAPTSIRGHSYVVA